MQAANEALDLYAAYFDCEGEEFDIEDARWKFIDAAISLLEKITDRNIGEELSS